MGTAIRGDPTSGSALRTPHSALRILVALALFQVLAGPIEVALADIGVGVGSDPVILGQPALAGQTYSMTPVYVVNTGTEPGRIHLDLQRFSEGAELPVPPQWIRLTDNDFVLAPQESKYVGVTLSVPGDTAPGAYLTNVLATVGSPAQPSGGTNIGAGAATRLTFTVVEAPAPGGVLSFVRTVPWWVAAAIGGAVVVVVLWIVLEIAGWVRRRRMTN